LSVLFLGTVIESADKQLALGLTDVYTTISNDGTNACAFLCVLIGERLLQSKIQIPTWQDIANFTDEIIRLSPSSFNHLRDKGRLYDAQEAVSILWRGGVLAHYELTEEIVSSAGVFTEEGKTERAGCFEIILRKSIITIRTTTTIFLTSSLPSSLSQGTY